MSFVVDLASMDQERGPCEGPCDSGSGGPVFSDQVAELISHGSVGARLLRHAEAEIHGMIHAAGGFGFTKSRAGDGVEHEVKWFELWPV